MALWDRLRFAGLFVGYVVCDVGCKASCFWRWALARRRLSSILRTCSGVIGDFALPAAAGARGGVDGRSIPATLNSRVVLLVDVEREEDRGDQTTMRREVEADRES